MTDFENIDEIFIENAINPIYNVNNNITDLNNSYKSNTGLLINYLTYRSSNLNYYIKYFIELYRLYYQIFNLPNIYKKNSIDFINIDINNYYITKSNFNNIPVTANTYDTTLFINENNLNKIIFKIVQKDSFGNIPSLICCLLADQINTIIKSNIITSYLTYKIPILVPWGSVDPYILYHIYNNKKQNKDSYIINFGGCSLDELSAYVQYIKSEKLYLKYGSQDNKFLERSYNNNKLIYTDFLLNYKNTYTISGEYFVDLSDQYIIYLGIDNNYGWDHPLEFFKYYSKSLKTYIYNTNNNNISNYYDISINDLSNNYVNNDDVKYNPNVIMINIKKFSTTSDENTLKYGKLVNKAFDYLDYLINNDLSNVDLSNIHIFVRNFGKEGDYELLKKLYDPSFNKYIPLTTGSFYDFREENFSNSYFDISNNYAIFDGLKSITNFNLSEITLAKLINEKLNIYSDRINDNITSSNYFNLQSFDQIRYQETLINFLQIFMLINYIQLKNGIIETNDSNNFIYKIFSGEQLYNYSLSFDFKELCDSFGVSYNGFGLNNFILSGLISTTYNNNNYWDISNGYPFNRNTFYSVCKRKYNYYDPSVFNESTELPQSPKTDLNINFNWASIYKQFLDRKEGDNISFSSDIDLVNAIIFKINGDTSNFNLYYNNYITSMNSL